DLTTSIADAGARLRSLRQIERELTELLARRENDTRADIVTAQAEFGKVRGQIESLDSRLRSQQRRVRLATIDVSLRERHDPTPESLPSYGRTVASAARDALMLLDRVVYGVVVSSPFWIAGLLGWVVWLIYRRLTRR
ncbi:MAG: DUF4349 domain-containing protein, partial [Planctomycetota bacterium]